MRENKLNISEELKQLEDKYESNFWKSKKLQKRAYEQCVLIVDRWLNDNISVIRYPDDIEIRGAGVYLSTNVLGYKEFFVDQPRIAQFVFDSNGDYNLIVESCGFIDKQNFKEFTLEMK